MMRFKSILILLLLLAHNAVRAYDFSATTVEGHTLYFNYIAGGVEVTHPSDNEGYINAWSGFAQPEGLLTIPSYVSDGDSTYAVLRVGKVAFYKCEGITSIKVSEGVTQIDDYAFSFCTKVTGLSLPSTLFSLGNQSLANLTALTDLWCAAVALPTTHTFTFYNTDLESCTLHVDCSAIETYADDEIWSAFGTLTEEGCKATLIVKAGKAAFGTTTGSGKYEKGTSVTLAATAFDKYKFLCWNDADTLNPRVVTVTQDTLFTALFVPDSFGIQYKTDTVVLAKTDTVTQFDTVYVAVPVHDTAVNYDTVYVAVPVHDTVYSVDTLIQVEVMHDTVMPTFFNIKVQSNDTQLGIGVGTAHLPAGVEAEICGLPIEGGRFVAWNDGNTQNPRRITVTSAITLTAQFEKLAADQVEAEAWSYTLKGRLLSVYCVDNQPVRLYDIQGRILFTVPAHNGSTTFEVPSSGMYLLQVGEGVARRIIVN